MTETRRQRLERLKKIGQGNPKKHKRARRKRPSREKNPLRRIKNPFKKQEEPKLKEVPREKVTAKQAKEVVDRMRRGMQGLDVLDKEESWLDKIKKRFKK